MRELDGRSYREIAETLGVCVAAVETLIFRARRALRSQRATLRALGAGAAAVRKKRSHGVSSES